MSYINDDFDLDERLKHLPLRKRRELAFITKTVLESFARIMRRKGRVSLREGKVLKLILFGSHARGGWVEDHASGYYSDYDILAVVNHEDCAEPEHWYKIEDLLLEEEMAGRLKAPVDLIVHSYEDMNGQLAVGRPFFADIVREGIMLHEIEGQVFVKPGKMTKEQKLEEGRKYFDELYRRSLVNYEFSEMAFSKAKGEMNEYMRKAAFEAHQASEHIYNCLLLTLTLYSPKSHKLDRLRQLANAVAPELVTIWPRSRKFYKRCFGRLLRAYVEARYSPHYEITAEEMQWLYERIALLQSRVKHICEDYLRQ